MRLESGRAEIGVSQAGRWLAGVCLDVGGRFLGYTSAELIDNRSGFKVVNGCA